MKLTLNNFLGRKIRKKTSKPTEEMLRKLGEKVQNNYQLTCLWNYFLIKNWEEELPDEPHVVPNEEAAGHH